MRNSLKSIFENKGVLFAPELIKELVAANAHFSDKTGKTPLPKIGNGSKIDVIGAMVACTKDYFVIGGNSIMGEHYKITVFGDNDLVAYYKGKRYSVPYVTDESKDDLHALILRDYGLVSVTWYHGRNVFQNTMFKPFFSKFGIPKRERHGFETFVTGVESGFWFEGFKSGNYEPSFTFKKHIWEKGFEILPQSYKKGIIKIIE